MADNNTVYFISGANRGIGWGLVNALAQREGTIIFAGTRNPESSAELNKLSQTNKNVYVVKLSSTSEEEARDAVQRISTIVNKIDIVIANAGISNSYRKAVTESIAQVREHFEVNTLGPLILFQASYKLLKNSATPKFIVISTGMASIGDMDNLPFPNTAYASSKVAVNFITRKINQENQDINLIAFPISPGWVQTEMGNRGANENGLEMAPVTLQQSVNGILGKIDNATQENSGGKFLSFDDTLYKW